MEPRGVGMGWLCMAVLCCGAALVLKEEKPRQQSTTTQQGDSLEPTGPPTTSTGDVDKLTTWPTANSTPPWTREPTTTPTLTQADTTGNKTQNASAVPIRYWSPAIFVVVALLVLFFTYRRTKGEATQDHAAAADDSSDLGALDHLPSQDTVPIIPTAQQEERKGPRTPPAPEHTETTFCQPDPPAPQPLLPQPDTPPATSNSRCSGEPSAD